MANPQVLKKLSINPKGISRMQGKPANMVSQTPAMQAPAPAPVPQDATTQAAPTPMKKGGKTASKRADGCCVKGKTRA